MPQRSQRANVSSGVKPNRFTCHFVTVTSYLTRFGHYVTALDGQGRPKLREGFHVACQTDTDCHSRCGIHPVNGMSYVCTKNLRLYDHQGSNETYPDGYYISERDEFDIHNSSTGVCTDVRIDYFHTGCESRSGAAVTIGLAGCPAAMGWASIWCGISIDRSGPDFLDVSAGGSAFDYPRVLAEQVEVDGVVVPRVECQDIIDCNIKCQRFSRSSRAGGLPVPSGCALCSPVCPNNLVTSIVSTSSALIKDISIVGRILEASYHALTLVRQAHHSHALIFCTNRSALETRDLEGAFAIFSVRCVQSGSIVFHRHRRNVLSVSTG